MNSQRPAKWSARKSSIDRLIAWLAREVSNCEEAKHQQAQAHKAHCRHRLLRVDVPLEKYPRQSNAGDRDQAKTRAGFVQA